MEAIEESKNEIKTLLTKVEFLEEELPDVSSKVYNKAKVVAINTTNKITSTENSINSTIVLQMADGSTDTFVANFNVDIEIGSVVDVEFNEDKEIVNISLSK